MKYESSFKSEADGLEISVMALIPDKKPYRAVVQLVHGMSEHKERYIPFMQRHNNMSIFIDINSHIRSKKGIGLKECRDIRLCTQRIRIDSCKQMIHGCVCAYRHSVNMAG